MRSKEERSGKKEAERNESKVDVGRLKSPMLWGALLQEGLVHFTK